MKKPIKVYVIKHGRGKIKESVDGQFLVFPLSRLAEYFASFEDGDRVRKMYLVEEPNEKAD